MERLKSLNQIDLEDIAKCETPAELRRDSDPMHRMKRIGLIGSISLLTNNITGPGMICTTRFLNTFPSSCHVFALIAL